jgi:threonine dehydratase
LLEEIKELSSIVVPIGGGGLISGIATAAKALNPKIKIIGVVSSQAAGMRQMFKGITPEPYPRRIATIADGIAVKNPSKLMYDTYINRLVDDVVEVDDDDIAQAIVFLLEKSKTVVEGSGAAGLAAVMSQKLELGAKSVVMLTGGNIDLNIISKVIERGLRRTHRLARISVIVDDLPGNLHRLTGVMASKRANILEVHHDRVSPELGLRETRIDVLVETSSDEQIEEIKEALKSLGFKI